MRIVGYCTNGNKQYVAFKEKDDIPDQFKITDGFHDKLVNKVNEEKFNTFQWTDKQDIDLERIMKRLRGTRPWHPLIKLLGKEAVV